MKKATILIAMVLALCLSLPIISLADGRKDFGTVGEWNEHGMVYDKSGRGAILYAEQSTDSDQLGLYYNGYVVSADVYNEEWAHVNVGVLMNQRTGFMSRDQLILYTALPNASIPDLPVISQFGSLLGDGDVTLRDEPNHQAQSLGEYLSGSIGRVVGELGEWYYFNIKGTPGFIHKNNLELLNEPNTYVAGITVPSYPTLGFVRLDPANEEVPVYNFTTNGIQDIWKTAEYIEYGLDELALIADLGEWYQVGSAGDYYIESKYFLDSHE